MFIVIIYFLYVAYQEIKINVNKINAISKKVACLKDATITIAGGIHAISNVIVRWLTLDFLLTNKITKYINAADIT